MDYKQFLNPHCIVYFCYSSIWLILEIEWSRKLWLDCMYKTKRMGKKKKKCMYVCVCVCRHKREWVRERKKERKYRYTQSHPFPWFWRFISWLTFLLKKSSSISLTSPRWPVYMCKKYVPTYQGYKVNKNEWPTPFSNTLNFHSPTRPQSHSCNMLPTPNICPGSENTICIMI